MSAGASTSTSTVLRKGPVCEVVRREGPEGVVFEKRYSVAWPWIPLAGLLKGNMPVLDGRREARNAERLRALGIAAPRALAAGACWRLGWAGPVHESWVALEEVPGTPLDRALAAGLPRPERRRIAAALGALVGAMHRVGIFHRDLYLCHALACAASGRVALIDVARAERRRVRRERWRAKDLGALALSARGLATRGDQAAFLRAYFGGPRIPREARVRAIVRRALAKADVLARRGRKG